MLRLSMEVGAGAMIVWRADKGGSRSTVMLMARPHTIRRPSDVHTHMNTRASWHGT
mgnify:CR=1 FL=1